MSRTCWLERLASPQPRDAVGVELLVGAHDGNAFGESLNHQHAVEWIAVVKGEVGQAIEVLHRNRQPLEISANHVLIEKTAEATTDIELLSAHLDRHFPGAGDAD